ncbi:hypothetical protein [Bradyrhizobium genosp. P]|uniref:hypothetical protein n=1 Tax=Bradyrhizobium genosp. P TaxID=83641 RepID=UPI003CF0250D
MPNLIDITKALREQRKQLVRTRRDATTLISRSVPGSDLKAATTKYLAKINAAIASVDEALKYLDEAQPTSC